MHVRKGDTVVVIAGKDKGKRGRSAPPHREGPRRRRGRQHGQAPHQADAAQPAGRHHREGGLDPRLERGALVRQVRGPASREASSTTRAAEAPRRASSAARRSRPRRLRDAEDFRPWLQDEKEDKGGKGAKPTLTPEQEAEAAAKKAARARGQGQGRGARAPARGRARRRRRRRRSPPSGSSATGPARLRKLYDERDRADADQGVRAQEPDAGAAPREDHDQHGSRRGRDEPEDHRPAVEELAAITGQRPVVTKAKKSIADLQAPRAACDRRDGHPAPRADVGVPRPPGQLRAAARARLQGRLAQGASTGAATTRSASGSRSSSPRSTTTRSTR